MKDIRITFTPNKIDLFNKFNKKLHLLTSRKKTRMGDILRRMTGLYIRCVLSDVRHEV